MLIRRLWRLKSLASRLFAQPFAQAQIKENIKARRRWSLCWESTGHRWIPLTKGQSRGKRFLGGRGGGALPLWESVGMRRGFAPHFQYVDDLMPPPQLCKSIVLFRFCWVPFWTSSVVPLMILTRSAPPTQGFNHVGRSFNLFMATTGDVWIPSFRIWGYVHVEHISCVITTRIVTNIRESSLLLSQ